MTGGARDIVTVGRSLWPTEPWRRNHWGTIGLTFMNFAGFGLVSPFWALYVQQLGVTDRHDAAVWAGTLLGLGPLLSAFLLPVWSRLADRYGYRLLLGRSVVGFAAAAALTALAQAPWHLAAIRCPEGLFAGFSAMCPGYLAADTPRDRRRQSVGELQAAQIVSVIIGPVLGG